eukprot:m.342253 g.342253  ORF g.342253 m.342253 type:complete len:400 (+) comp21144_c0_seq1:285-1484(+)
MAEHFRLALVGFMAVLLPSFVYSVDPKGPEAKPVMHAYRAPDDDYPLPLVPYILHCLDDNGTIYECGNDSPFHRPELLRAGVLEERGLSYNLAFRKNSYRTTFEEEAVISFMCCYLNMNHGKLLENLPKRAKNKPYVIWYEEHNEEKRKYNANLLKRDDMIFFSMDLLDHASTREKDMGPEYTGPNMVGFVFPPPIPLGFNFKGAEYCTARQRKYHLTFKGKKNLGLHASSTVRADLKASWQEFSKTYKGPNEYYMEIIETQGEFYDPKGPGNLKDVFNTTFALCPRGHGRWTYRFGEILEWNTIPVVMSDGWVLPFHTLIDWSKAVVVIKEEVAKQGFQAILDQLPTSESQIKSMQDYICNVVHKYMGPYNNTIKSAIASAMRYAEKERGASFKGLTL